jgi:hypothetical protein
MSEAVASSRKYNLGDRRDVSSVRNLDVLNNTFTVCSVVKIIIYETREKHTTYGSVPSAVY